MISILYPNLLVVSNEVRQELSIVVNIFWFRGKRTHKVEEGDSTVGQAKECQVKILDESLSCVEDVLGKVKKRIEKISKDNKTTMAMQTFQKETFRVV